MSNKNTYDTEDRNEISCYYCTVKEYLDLNCRVVKRGDGVEIVFQERRIEK